MTSPVALPLWVCGGAASQGGAQDEANLGSELGSRVEKGGGTEVP